MEALISKYELSQRLTELEELTAEADERQHSAFADLKDVWRPDLDIQTAIRARVSADQTPRIDSLQAELAELREQNLASEQRLHGTEAQIDTVRANVTNALEMLDKVRKPNLTRTAAGQCVNQGSRRRAGIASHAGCAAH